MTSLQPCGHFYDPRTSSTCPYCGIQIEGTVGPFGGHSSPNLPGGGTAPINQEGQRGGTAPPNSPGAKPLPPDDGATIGYGPKGLGGGNPVVGWLVCIEGKDRGRDYKIYTERNWIGRDPTMDIAISSDGRISRQRHAFISYNPKQHSFTLGPGESRGLVYLNGEELLAATRLNPYDQIQLGDTKLLFVPFCGERFTWPV